jgi:glycosyltransferase involved in cell wall biosynthesis
MSLADVEPDRSFVEAGVQVIRLGDTIAWSWRTLRAIVQLRSVLKELKPEFVHLHGARPIFVGSIAARLAGVRAIICSLHGAYNLMAADAQGEVSFSRDLLARFVHGLGFILSRRVIVCAARMTRDVDECIRVFPFVSQGRVRARLRVIHHGIEFERFAECRLAAPCARPAAATLVVGTLSRLDEPMKGIAILLRAVVLLQQRGVSVSLRVAGSGYSRDALEREAARLQLQDCQFLGYVPDPRQFYRSLDIFVLPSFSEGMPLVNLEAMAAGAAVVTTNVGGAAEAVRHEECGLVVEPGDVEALATAIERLATDPILRGRLARAGREVVANEFTNHVMFRKLSAVYDEVRCMSGGEGVG